MKLITANEIFNTVCIHILYIYYDLTDITDKFIYLFIEKSKTVTYRHWFFVFLTHGIRLQFAYYHILQFFYLQIILWFTYRYTGC